MSVDSAYSSLHYFVLPALHSVKTVRKIAVKIHFEEDEKKSIKNLLADSRNSEAADKFASLFVMGSSELFVYSELFVVVELLDFAAEILSLLMILQLLAIDGKKVHNFIK